MPHRRRSLVLAATALVLLIVVLEVFVPPGNTRWWNTVFNAGHAPLFGVFSWIALWGVLRAWPAAGRSRVGRYLAVFALAASAGAGSEILQHFTGRDAELGDWARDLAGITACLLMAAAFDPRLPVLPRRRAPARVALLALAFIPVWIVAEPVLEVGNAYRERDLAFPVLLSFDAAWERFFFSVSDGSVAWKPLPAPSREREGNLAGRVTLNALPDGYPGISMSEPVGDWTGYRTLAFTVVSPSPEPRALQLRVDDAFVKQDWSRASYVEFTVRPGRNRIRIPLETIRAQPSGHPLDMSRIAVFEVFAAKPRLPLTFFVDDFRLER